MTAHGVNHRGHGERRGKPQKRRLTQRTPRSQSRFDAAGCGAGPEWQVDSLRGERTRPQAVCTPAAGARPSSTIEISRILNFWIFPVTVIGNSAVNRTYRGIL